jgi:carotenoid cleavage dioxygenase
VLRGTDELPAVLQGNFFPTPNEGTFPVTVLEGALPADLRGHFVRVGPNPRFSLGGQAYHPFDGDGMVHAVHFPGGGENASYSKRWVRTERFEKAEQRGYDTFPFAAIFDGKFDELHLNVGDDGMSMGTANTNVVAHAGRQYALYESDKPYELRLGRDKETGLAQFETVGKSSMGGQLTHPVAAHPKVDCRTGEMMMMGYELSSGENANLVHYSVLQADGTVSSSASVRLPHPALMHDMAITARHTLLFDPNFQFDVLRAMAGESPFVHRRDLPARFGVLPRHCGPDKQGPAAQKGDGKQREEAGEAAVRWIETAGPCGVFHFGNAWEETVEELGSDGQSRTRTLARVYGCRADDMSVDLSVTPQNTLHEWVLDLDSMQCISERALSEHVCDFPQVDQSRQGYPTRHIYAVEFEQDKETVRVPQSNLYFKAVLKFDLKTGVVHRHAAASRTGGQSRIGETVFAPATATRTAVGTEAEAEAEEGAGYLVCFGHDEETGESECLVIDAASMELVCRLGFPVRVPFGFHAVWVPESSQGEGGGGGGGGISRL